MNSTDRFARYFLNSGRQIDFHYSALLFDGEEIANHSLDGYVTAFSTTYTYLHLPRPVGESVVLSIWEQTLLAKYHVIEEILCRILSSI